MATATDIYQEVLFSDGEGATPDDANELQRRMRGMILDTMIAMGVYNGIQNADGGIADRLDPELSDWLIGPTDLLGDLQNIGFTPYPQTGFTEPGGANEVRIKPGVFVQWAANDWVATDVDAPAVNWFALKTDVDLATAVGDATNPRMDIVEMKLEIVEDTPDARDFEDAITRAKSTTNPNKARRTKATFQIKQGTPAASPSYPACTAGFVPIAAVWIPATHNGGHSIVDMRDLRWPIGGVRVYDVTVEGFNLAFTNPWTHANNDYRALADPTNAGKMRVPCPIGGHSSRLIAVGVFGEFPGDGETLLRRMTIGTAPPTYTTLKDLQTAIHDPMSPGPAFAWATAIDFMDTPDIANEAARAANTHNGTPIWVNGQLSGPSFERAVTDPAHTTLHKLIMEFEGATPDAGTSVTLVRWVIAHGM